MISLVELVLEREIDALLDVGDDDQRAHGRREIIVRVPPGAHIFGEIFGLHQFADIVKISANPAHRRICSNDLRRGLGQIRDDEQ